MIEKGIRLGTMTLKDLEKSGGFDAALKGFAWFYLGHEFCENLLDASVCEDAAGCSGWAKKYVSRPRCSEKKAPDFSTPFLKSS